MSGKTSENKKGILLVAYGKSGPQSDLALQAFQRLAGVRFSLPVRLAFTSEPMRNRLAHARTKTDSVYKALSRMSFDRYTHVAVQTLHVIPGLEYHDVLDDIERFQKTNRMNVSVSRPLLADAGDIPEVAAALCSLRPEGMREDDFLLFMGHGSKHQAENFYTGLDDAVHQLNPHVQVACMKGHRTLDNLLSQWKAPCRVWLAPLLSVVGKHTLEDMAGERPDSWKSRLIAAGFQVQTHLHGLVEFKELQQLWMNRMEKTLQELNDVRESL